VLLLHKAALLGQDASSEDGAGTVRGAANRLKMPERTDWEAKARGILRSEMAKQNVTYSQLPERLKSVGV